MPQIYANNFATTLATAITTGSTAVVVATGTGASCPAVTAPDYIKITLSTTDAPASHVEVIHCTHVASSDTFTVVGGRGQEDVGSAAAAATPFAFQVGDLVEARFTAASAGAPTERGYAAQASDIGSPASGNAALFVKRMAGRDAFRVVSGFAGGLHFLQESIIYGNVMLWMHGNNNSESQLGTAHTGVGTMGDGAKASTNRLTSTHRHVITSAATINALASRTAADNWTLRGNTAGVGGFYVFMRYAMETALSPTGKLFVGWSASNPSASAEPSALTHFIGLGADGGDTNITLMTNNGTTTTKTALTTPVAKTSVGTAHALDLHIYCAPNASTIAYQVDDWAGGTINTVATGFSTTIPGSTTFGRHMAWINTGGTSTTAVVLSLVRMATYWL